MWHPRCIYRHLIIINLKLDLLPLRLAVRLYAKLSRLSSWGMDLILWHNEANEPISIVCLFLFFFYSLSVVTMNTTQWTKSLWHIKYIWYILSFDRRFDRFRCRSSIRWRLEAPVHPLSCGRCWKALVHRLSVPYRWGLRWSSDAPQDDQELLFPQPHFIGSLLFI